MANDNKGKRVIYINFAEDEPTSSRLSGMRTGDPNDGWNQHIHTGVKYDEDGKPYVLALDRSDKRDKLMEQIEEEHMAKVKAEQAWINYAKSIEPYVGKALAKKIRRDLSDRKTLAELKQKFRLKGGRHIFILQATPPEVVGIKKSQCAYPHCIYGGYTRHEAYRLSLERRSRLASEEVDIKPLEPRLGCPKEQVYGKGAEGQTWYCLECIESLYNGEGLMTSLKPNLQLTAVCKPQDGVSFTTNQAPNNQDGSSNAKPSKPAASKKKISKPAASKAKIAPSVCGICICSLEGTSTVSCAMNACAGGVKFHQACGVLFPGSKDEEGFWICPKCAIREEKANLKPADDNCRICLCNMADHEAAPCARDDCEDGGRFHLCCAQLFPDNKDNEEYWLCPKCDKSRKQMILDQSPRELFDDASLPARCEPPAALQPKIPGQNMFQQISHLIFSEMRAHNSEFFVLNYPRNHALWKWKNTITRQILFEDKKNMAFLKKYDLLKYYVYASPKDIMRDPDLRTMNEAPARYYEKELMGLTPFGGYVVELDADAVRNRNLSAVLKECDKICLEKNQLLAKNDEEYFIPKPYKPRVTLVLEDEVQEAQMVESSSDDEANSVDSDPVTFDGFSFAVQ